MGNQNLKDNQINNNNNNEEQNHDPIKKQEQLIAKISEFFVSMKEKASVSVAKINSYIDEIKEKNVKENINKMTAKYIDLRVEIDEYVSSFQPLVLIAIKDTKEAIVEDQLTNRFQKSILDILKPCIDDDINNNNENKKSDKYKNKIKSMLKSSHEVLMLIEIILSDLKKLGYANTILIEVIVELTLAVAMGLLAYGLFTWGGALNPGFWNIILNISGGLYAITTGAFTIASLVKALALIKELNSKVDELSKEVNNYKTEITNIISDINKLSFNYNLLDVEYRRDIRVQDLKDIQKILLDMNTHIENLKK